MDFEKVNYDGDLDSAEADDLRSLVSQYEEAQEQNVAEFEAAQERMNDLADATDGQFEAVIGEIKEFGEVKAELIEEITEFESFDSSPVTESDLESAEFSKVREYHEYFGEQDAAADAEENAEEESSEFNDMGRRGETHEETDDREWATKYLSGMPGFTSE